jgi:hypothetical protein
MGSTFSGDFSLKLDVFVENLNFFAVFFKKLKKSYQNLGVEKRHIK